MKHLSDFVLQTLQRLKLTKGRLRTNILVLSSGTALAQLIPILTSPILARLYTPADFGYYALYGSVVALFAVAASGRYEHAVILPESDRDANALVLLSALLALGFSLACLILAIGFADSIARLMGLSGWHGWLVVAPAGIFFAALYYTLTYWLNRHQRYGLMTRNRITQAVLGGILSVSFGLLGLSPLGLILGPLLAIVITTATVAYLYGKDIANQGGWFDTAALVPTVAKNYIQHPVHLLPSHWMVVLASQLPILTISTTYGITIAGLYLLANRTVILPTQVIANAIGDIYRREISVRYRTHGEFRSIFVKMISVTAAIAAIPILLLIVVAPDLFGLVFGEPWRPSGDFLRLLGIAAFFQFVVTPVDKGAIVVGATHLIFGLSFLRFLLTAALCGAALVFQFDVKLFISLLAAIGSLIYILDGLVQYRLSKGYKVKEGEQTRA